MKVFAAVLLLTTAVARAEPAEPPPADDQHTTDSVRGEPRPGEESGRIDEEPDDSAGRKVGRTLLWVPRTTVQLVATPVRGFLKLNDEHDVIRRVTEVFTTDDHKIALYPTALFETGLGVNVGMRGFVKDLFGEGERLRARGGFGGEYRWIVSASLHSGQRFGPLALSVDGRRAIRDHEWFYGYGNEDAPGGDPMTGQVSPGRYRVEISRGLARAALRLPARVRLTATSALTEKRFAAEDTETMFENVPSFTAGTTFSYNELELAWDTRRAADPWDAPGMRGTGGLATLYGGYQYALDDTPAFGRFGFDVQRFVRLTSRPRVLELRIAGEMVTGARDQVPFTELPRLGGHSLLRGYDVDRFRDRVATTAQACYSWAAANWLAPSLFVDVGRVYSGLDALSLDHPRVGFGMSFDAYSRRGLVARTEIASSIDGGLFLYLALNPAFDAGARAERY